MAEDFFKNFLEEHPERAEIFLLNDLLWHSGIPYFFNVADDLRPTPFGEPDPADIDWGGYIFLIQVGNPLPGGLAELSVTFSSGSGGTLLEILDMRQAKDKAGATAADGILAQDLTAAECMDVIRDFWETDLKQRIPAE